MGRILNGMIAVLLVVTAILWATNNFGGGGWRWGMVALCGVMSTAAAVAAVRK